MKCGGKRQARSVLVGGLERERTKGKRKTRNKSEESTRPGLGSDVIITSTRTEPVIHHAPTSASARLRDQGLCKSL